MNFKKHLFSFKGRYFGQKQRAEASSIKPASALYRVLAIYFNYIVQWTQPPNSQLFRSINLCIHMLWVQDIYIAVATFHVLDGCYYTSKNL